MGKEGFKILNEKYNVKNIYKLIFHILEKSTIEKKISTIVMGFIGISDIHV